MASTIGGSQFPRPLGGRNAASGPIESETVPSPETQREQPSLYLEDDAVRASKENADIARRDLLTLEAGTLGGRKRLDLSTQTRLHDAFTRLAEFLNAAKAKLPTEAAYNRDHKRSRDND